MTDPAWWQGRIEAQRAIRDQWLDEFRRRGGKEEEVAPLLALEPAMRELLRRGPCGYGSLPPGCTATSDPALVRRGRFSGFTSRRNQLVDRVGLVVGRRKAALGMTGVHTLGLPGCLPQLWSAEARLEDARHEFWSRMEAVVFESEALKYFQYQLARGMGADAIPELEACVAAFIAGHLPVRCEPGQVQAFSLPADQLAQLTEKAARA